MAAYLLRADGRWADIQAKLTGLREKMLTIDTDFAKAALTNPLE